jgi:enoyl-CoA hydratase/carnithine racemase
MGATDFETLEWHFDSERGVGRIVLDRPDSLNALSNGMLTELTEALGRFERRDEESGGVAVRAVAIAGGGDDAFCVGADLKEIARGDGEFPGKTGAGHEVFDAVERFPAPVLAEVDGYCLGGGLELAVACDFRFASGDSTFGQPEIHLGLFPGAGATHRLPDLVGANRAKELMMTGDTIEAGQAIADGLVDRVYPSERFADACREFLDTLADRPPLAVRGIKDVVDTTGHLDTEAAENYATHAYRRLAESEDHRRGLEAYFEDEEPEWVGR